MPCTLSDGSAAECYEVVAAGTPADHAMGPWCPGNVADDASAGGIWLEGGEVYDVDGAFVEKLAAFYGDPTWRMYDANGDIYVTATQEECEAAARPDVGEEYENYCVECLPSYVADLTHAYLLPMTPVRQASPADFAMGPGGGGGGAAFRALAFNGIAFDNPAPVNAILGAYTLAPFDDAGGHVNPFDGYHYHAATGASTEVAQADGHAPMIGYAADGFGLYAQLDASGAEPTDLDACRGHADDTRGYHYHVDAAGANNFVNCLGGAYPDPGGGRVGRVRLGAIAVAIAVAAAVAVVVYRRYV